MYRTIEQTDNSINVRPSLVACVTYFLFQSLGETHWERFNERNKQVSRKFVPWFRYGTCEVSAGVKLPSTAENAPHKNLTEVFIELRLALFAGQSVSSIFLGDKQSLECFEVWITVSSC